ncbi:MAG TPA: YCF48-related protein [Candidatus Limnocylindrales bacterium]|nr:YCF48-related protein [Candidatus Limnocylindrales bacterium]
MGSNALSGRWRGLPLAVLAATAVTTGCHRHEAMEDMLTQKVYVSDRFYDLEILSPKEALIVGYNGKLLQTSDFGTTWNIIDSGSKNGLYSISFAADKKSGWIVGQGATIQKTTDGGKTWTAQGGKIYMTDDCRASGGDIDATDESDKCPLAPLFAISAIDANNAVAIGDRSTITITKDGGKTWTTSTLRPVVTGAMDENAGIAFEDPVLYDVQFLSPQVGYVVGEFGKILKTTDGGATWHDKQASLVGEEYFDIMELPTFFDVEFRNANDGYAVGLEGRIAKTSDGGETWSWAPHGIKEYDAPFYSVDLLPSGAVWAVGGSGQAVYAPPGGTLAKGNLGTQVNNWIRNVEFYDDNVGWMVGGFGFIMNTTDGGKTWFRRLG